MYCMISSWPVSPGEAIISWRVHGVESPGMETSPGERKSLSFLSLWEDYGFVFLGIVWGLCSFGDLDMFITFWGRFLLF